MPCLGRWPVSALCGISKLKSVFGKGVLVSLHGTYAFIFTPRYVQPTTVATMLFMSSFLNTLGALLANVSVLP